MVIETYYMDCSIYCTYILYFFIRARRTLRNNDITLRNMELEFEDGISEILAHMSTDLRT